MDKTEKGKSEIKKGTRYFWQDIKAYLGELLDLKKGMDRAGTIKSIRDNKRMHGANAWLLMCSIMVASLGLDLNSPAVIIGAMLISPLMSPILGIGLSVGINDRVGLGVALHHLLIAIGIALVTSFLYFYLTPFGEPTDEIMSRTEPTLLDVMVAFFGGIAGIVSGSRKDKSNAIPGVAIATALMPPLCVTGFGLAHGDWDIALRSFYLFFLNATFVAVATYLIVRLLRFRMKEHLNEADRRKTRLIILGFTLVMLIPSCFILAGVLEKVQKRQAIEAFVKTHFPDAYFPKIEETAKRDSLLAKVFLFEEISDDSLALIQESFRKEVPGASLKLVTIDTKEEITREEFVRLGQSI
ncbi:MAG: DUF389 domain-containing protein, partial [Bacteroidetes bacterium]